MAKAGLPSGLEWALTCCLYENVILAILHTVHWQLFVPDALVLGGGGTRFLYSSRGAACGQLLEVPEYNTKFYQLLKNMVSQVMIYV